MRHQLNKFQEVKNITDQISSSYEGAQVNNLEFAATVVNSGFSTITLFALTVPILSSIITVIASILHIDATYVTLAIGGIGVLIIILIFQAFLRWVLLE